MKKLLLLFVVMLGVTSFSASAQILSGIDANTYQFVDEEQLKNTPQQVSELTNSYISDITSAETATCSDAKKIKKFQKAIAKIVKRQGFKKSFETKTDDVQTTIYKSATSILVSVKVDNDYATATVITGAVK